MEEKDFVSLQSSILANIQLAVNNASNAYMYSRQFGESSDVELAWNNYVKIRDLYEDLLQNTLV